MGIKNIVLGTTGADNIKPRIDYIETNNTPAEVVATGFLNEAVQQGNQFADGDMVLVSTKSSPSAIPTQSNWYAVAKVGTDTSLVAPLNSNIIAGKTADIGGGGAGAITVAVSRLTASSVVVATIESSTNTVAVAKVVAGAGEFDITFDGDPGAACVVNYVAFVVPQ